MRITYVFALFAICLASAMGCDSAKENAVEDAQEQSEEAGEAQQDANEAQRDANEEAAESDAAASEAANTPAE
jgi:hypothetical protein